MMRFEIDTIQELKGALKAVCAEIDAADAVLFDLKLVIDELVSNVLRHGGGRARLTVEQGREIRVTVRGENGFRPPEKSVLSPVDAERGRGLYLVDALVSSRTYSEEDGIAVTISLE